MNRTLLRAHLRHPQPRKEIISEFCRGKVVLDLGCVCHNLANAANSLWLHKIIVEVSSETVGVDYLEAEVAVLRERGYHVVAGDVTRPLPIDRTFDVIVIGNLIEHLSNFEGLMNNLRRLLAHDGVVLIGTANPFFREQYFFSALNNDIIVNPEHTCWIDPVTLDQLSGRFGLETIEVRWVKEKWFLSHAIFHGDRQMLDIFTGQWTYPHPRPWLERVVAPWLERAFCISIGPARQRRMHRLYGEDLGNYLYMKMKGVAVDMWWRLRRCVIPNSDINRHEVYISVLKPQKAEGWPSGPDRPSRGED